MTSRVNRCCRCSCCCKCCCCCSSDSTCARRSPRPDQQTVATPRVQLHCARRLISAPCFDGTRAGGGRTLHCVAGSYSNSRVATSTLSAPTCVPGLRGGGCAERRPVLTQPQTVKKSPFRARRLTTPQTQSPLRPLCGPCALARCVPGGQSQLLGTVAPPLSLAREMMIYHQ